MARAMIAGNTVNDFLVGGSDGRFKPCYMVNKDGQTLWRKNPDYLLISSYGLEVGRGDFMKHAPSKARVTPTWACSMGGTDGNTFIYSDGSELYRTRDFKTYSKVCDATSFGGGEAEFYSVVYCNGEWVAGGHDMKIIRSSDDGLTWQGATGSKYSEGFIVTNQTNRIVICLPDHGSCVMYYYDFSTHKVTKSSTVFTTRGFFACGYGHGRYVAIRYDSSNKAIYPAYSTNGTSWTVSSTKIASITNEQWKNWMNSENASVVANNASGGAFITGVAGNVFRSTNGSSWSKVLTLPEDTNFAGGICYNGVFYICNDYNGEWISRDNGLTWESTPYRIFPTTQWGILNAWVRL